MLSTGRLLKLTRNSLMTSLNESKVKTTFNMDRCSSFSENFKPSLLSLSSQGRGLQKIGIYSPKSKFPILLQSHREFLSNDAEAEMIIPKYFKYVQGNFGPKTHHLLTCRELCKKMSNSKMNSKESHSVKPFLQD